MTESDAKRSKTMPAFIEMTLLEHEDEYLDYIGPGGSLQVQDTDKFDMKNPPEKIVVAIFSEEDVQTINFGYQWVGGPGTSEG